MSSRRSLVLVSAVALVGLLSLMPLQAAAGACGSVLRPASASWDQPTPQVVDELVSPSVAHADPATHARGPAALARPADARLVLPAGLGRIGSPGVDTGVTRSPPLV